MEGLGRKNKKKKGIERKKPWTKKIAGDDRNRVVGSSCRIEHHGMESRKQQEGRKNEGGVRERAAKKPKMTTPQDN